MAISVQHGDGGTAATVSPEGDLDVTTSGLLYERLKKLAGDPAVSAVYLDFARVGGIDSAGVAAVSLGRRELESVGKRLETRSMAHSHRDAFELQPSAGPLEAPAAPVVGFGKRTRRRGQRAWQALHELAELAVDAARYGGRCLARRERMPLTAIAEQSVLIGVNALPIVALLSFLLGLVLGFQSAFQLSRFGADEFMAEVVALGMVREFGPLITAIIVAGRTGAAMAAELGTMGVNEETDALRSMGISPIRFLVLPRLMGITLVHPPLSLMSMIVGIAGGLVIAVWVGMPWTAVYDRMIWSLSLDDFVLGLIKSLLFAWVIGLAACFMGMRTRGGARSVGASSTKAVVAAIFFIVVIDSIVTTTWTMGHYE